MCARYHLPLFGLILIIGLLSCDNYSIFEDYPVVGESDHFTVGGGSTNQISQEEVNALLLDLEQSYKALDDFLGSTNHPEHISVILKGDLEEDNNVPGYVDNDGIIYLYRLATHEGGYQAFTSHELVHAFRVDAIVHTGKASWSNVKFLEEGFAEFFASHFFTEKMSFSTFGMPSELVAWFWIQQDPDLTLQKARKEHDNLNAKCSHQLYPLRASWISFIFHEYGHSKLLDLIYPSDPPDDQFLMDLIGIDYFTVDALWKEWIEKRTKSIPNWQDLLLKYGHITVQIDPCDL